MADEYGLSLNAGAVLPIVYKIDSSSADIEIGDAITTTGATAGYVQKVDGAADVVLGFSEQKVASPANDGDAEVRLDISKETVYKFPADSGTVTQALVGTKVDIGADGRSIDINGTTTQDLEIVKVDTALGLVWVRRV